jgi:hypothetical protein
MVGGVLCTHLERGDGELLSESRAFLVGSDQEDLISAVPFVRRSILVRPGATLDGLASERDPWAIQVVLFSSIRILATADLCS